MALSGLTVSCFQCHSAGRVADRDPKKPFNREAAVEQFYRDLEDVKRLALDRKTPGGDPNPDLLSLPKILDLEARVLGLLGADGKRAPGSDSVPVPLDEVKKLIRAAEERQREKKNVEK